MRAGTYRDISERPSLPSPFKSNIRSCWGQKVVSGLFALTFSHVGPCPAIPCTGEEGGWGNMLMRPLRSPGGRDQHGLNRSLGRQQGLGHGSPPPFSGTGPQKTADQHRRPTLSKFILSWSCGGCHGNRCSRLTVSQEHLAEWGPQESRRRAHELASLLLAATGSHLSWT